MTSTGNAALMTLMVAMLVPRVAAAQEAPHTVRLSPDSRVRAVDGQARSLLETAVALSPTVARMVGSLQASDLIVNVELWPLSKKTRGELRLVAATATVRYVRIRISVPGSRDDMIAVLGHELQHAMELAAARAVIDPATERRYFERIGWAAIEDGYFETEAALETGRQVAAELSASKPGGRRGGM